MSTSGCVWRMADGRLVEVGHEGVIGRSGQAALRFEDGRVATVHAEVSVRAEGWTLLARGGRLRVDGRATSRVSLRPGLRVELAPGLWIEVAALPGESVAAVPDTGGRASRRWVVGAAGVVAFGADLPPEGWCLGGISGVLLANCLRAGEAGCAWHELAGAAWPEDAALRGHGGPGCGWTAIDERRLRNRFDQHLRLLRRQLAGLCPDVHVVVAGGTVRVVLAAGDAVVGCDAPRDAEG